MEELYYKIYQDINNLINEVNQTSSFFYIEKFLGNFISSNNINYYKINNNKNFNNNEYTLPLVIFDNKKEYFNFKYKKESLNLKNFK